MKVVEIRVVVSDDIADIIEDSLMNCDIVKDNCISGLDSCVRELTKRELEYLNKILPEEFFESN